MLTELEAERGRKSGIACADDADVGGEIAGGVGRSVSDAGTADDEGGPGAADDLPAGKS
jgi:hypothetical protein